MPDANGHESGDVSEQRISRLEDKLGSALPANYRDFLKHYGGYIFSPSRPVPLKNIDEMIGGVSVLFGIFSQPMHGVDLSTVYESVCDSDWPTDIYSGLASIKPIEEYEALPYDQEEATWVRWPGELLPIGDSGGNDMVCIIISGKRVGHIYYWVNDPSPTDPNIYHVADSFDEFVNLLGSG